MPRTVVSESTKAQVVAYIESAAGHKLVRKDHHTDWYCSEDYSFEVFLTYSQSDYNRPPWYDMQPADIERLATHRAGFIVFVLDDPNHCLVVPANDLKQHLSHAGSKTEDGRYMCHIDRRRKGEFREVPGWDLRPYLNNFSQTSNF